MNEQLRRFEPPPGGILYGGGGIVAGFAPVLVADRRRRRLERILTALGLQLDEPSLEAFLLELDG